MAIDTAPVPEPTLAQEPDDLTKSLQELALKTGLIAEHLREGKQSAHTAEIEAEYEKAKAELARLSSQKAEQDDGQKLSAAVEAYLAQRETKSRKLEFDAASAGSESSLRSHVGWKMGIPETSHQADLSSKNSFASVLWAAKLRADPEALKTLYEWHNANAEAHDMRWGKALAETTSTTGGYLVPPQFIQELVMLRRATAPLLNFIRMVPTRSNLVYVPTQTTVMTVGWTAENATKPSTDEVFSQIAVNVFTLAGIAKVSNQLLEDSTPAVDAVVREDLMRGLNIEMDRVVLNGSGTGQATGILNQSGITGTAVSAGTAVAIIDDVLAAIGRLQQAYFGNPDLIVMAPRTWTKLIGAKDTAGRYLALGTVVGSQTLNEPGLPSPTGATADGMGMGGGPIWNMFGFPVCIDANMPINQSGSLSSIIVGAFREAWMLTRDEIRTDVSNVAGTAFESNQTWFRSECRVGFTAARLTSAFQIITGETA
jgi:HK97 family phage major capsid protein